MKKIAMGLQRFILLVIFFATTVMCDKSKLTIVTHITPEVSAGFGKSTIKINQAYADRHGYSFVVDTKDYAQGGRDPRWNKIKAIQKVLDTLPVLTNASIRLGFYFACISCLTKPRTWTLYSLVSRTHESRRFI
jgi:hypothetical protein